MENHPFEALLPDNEELYTEWIQLTWALDRKFTDFHTPPPSDVNAHRRAVKATRRKISHIMRKRFSGAIVSLYGTFPLGLVQRQPANDYPVVHMSLDIPALLQQDVPLNDEEIASKSKRFLFQALHVLQRRQHQDVIHLKAYPGAPTPFLIGTYGYEGSFVHFELAITTRNSAEENTALLERYIRLDLRVKKLLQLILLWSETVPYKQSSTIGPYTCLTMGIHYLIWIGFVPDLREQPDPMMLRSKSRPSLHHLSPVALLYGFFRFYAHFPWSSRIVGLSLGEEHDAESFAGSILQMDDFANTEQCLVQDVSLVQESMEENQAYWESLVLKREPAQTDRLWLPKPPASILTK